MDPASMDELQLDADAPATGPAPSAAGPAPPPPEPVSARRADVGGYRALGRLVAHAIEATARNVTPGQTEEEIAGQVGHRLLHHGAEPAAVSVTADGRAARFRRAGAVAAPVKQTCVIQATAQRDGLYATASRAICFGDPPPDFRTEYALAQRTAAVYRSLSVPGETVHGIGTAARVILTP